MVEPKACVLELDDGALAYRVSGTGPLVVLTHAFGPLAWGDLTRLAGSCTVVVPDWESSTLDLEVSVTFAWFAPLVRAVGHEHGALCAWSMSGPGAIWFAVEAPLELSRLILVDVAGLGSDFPPLRWRDLLTFVWMRIAGRPTRGFVRMLWRGWVWRDDLDTRELEAATLRFFRAHPDAYGLPGSGSEEDDGDDDEDDDALLDELPAIRTPTLVLVGRHSDVLGPDHGRAAVAQLSRGEFVVFERSGHSLQLEEPERFQDTVAGFVSG